MYVVLINVDITASTYMCGTDSYFTQWKKKTHAYVANRNIQFGYMCVLWVMVHQGQTIIPLQPVLQQYPDIIVHDFPPKYS